MCVLCQLNMCNKQFDFKKKIVENLKKCVFSLKNACLFAKNKCRSHFKLELACFEREKTRTFFREIVRSQSVYCTSEAAKNRIKIFV